MLHAFVETMSMCVIENTKEQHYLATKTFCNINIFTDTDELNVIYW